MIPTIRNNKPGNIPVHIANTLFKAFDRMIHLFLKMENKNPGSGEGRDLKNIHKINLHF